jgi:hypothetical protein
MPRKEDEKKESDEEILRDVEKWQSPASRSQPGELLPSRFGSSINRNDRNAA